MTLGDLASIVTIAAFLMFVFIEWPRFKARWEESGGYRIFFLIGVVGCITMGVMLPVVISMRENKLVWLAFFSAVFLFLLGSGSMLIHDPDTPFRWLKFGIITIGVFGAGYMIVLMLQQI